MRSEKILVIALVFTFMFFGAVHAVQAEKIFRIAFFADPISVDPPETNDLNASGMLPQIVESLVRVDRNGKIIPDLAQRWEINEDGTEFTFYLRKGVKFHSGNELKAHHFKYAWTRSIAPGLPKRLQYKNMQPIKGSKDVYEGKTDEFVGVQAADDYTLKVIMDEPYPEFIQVLSMFKFAPLEKEIVEKGGGKITPDNVHGTGAFKLVSHKKRSVYHLRAHEDYWGGRPKFDGVDFYVVTNELTALQMYENNELDMVKPPVSNVPRILNDPKLSKELHQIPRLRSCICAFNYDLQPAFHEIRVRKAFNMAVDKTVVARVALENTVVPARSNVPSGSFGRDIDRKGYPYDPEQARKLMAEAGYPKGKGFPKINLYTRPQQVYIRAAEIVSSMLKQNLGVDAQVISLEFGKYRKDLGQRDVFDFFFFCWTAGYPSPKYHLTEMLTSDAHYNFWNYKDPVMDELAQKAGTTIDYEKRIDAYLEMEKRVIDQAIVLPLYYDVYLYMVKPWVKNVDWIPTEYGYLKLGLASFEE